MRHKLLVLSGLSFVAAWAGFQQYVRRVEFEVSGGPKMAVLVATKDLSTGALLDESSLASVSIPARYVDGRRVPLSEKVKVLGGELAVDIEAGQGLMWSDVTSAEGPTRLALLLPPGRRAYSVPSSTNPMGSLLKADDEVDILLLREKAAEVLLEKVRVLGVGRILRGAQPGEEVTYSRKDDVTLDVTLDQAETLLAAESRGRLRLVLRHPEDEGVSAPEAPQAVVAKAGSSRPTAREIERVR